MVQDKLDHWFRHEYSRLLSIFISKYGLLHLENIEDAIHDALYQAMRVWGYQHNPDQPAAWIYRVAQNRLIDQLRKKSFDSEIPELAEEHVLNFNNEVEDPTLKLIFACCHQNLKEEESIILCLKFAAGFGLKEVSRALFISYEATKKRFQRAKTHFKSANLSLDIPSRAYLNDRLRRVLKVIFLIFTEGYRPTEGDLILKEDLCFEALRMALALDRHEEFQSTELHALIALMSFKSARIEARMDHDNAFIRLKDQDRRRWSRDLIREGNRYLALAFKKDNQSEYHFHAAVESQYVIAPSFEKTNWQGLLNIYNYWRKLMKNPALELNRIVVVMYAEGAEMALREMEANCEAQNNHLYYSIRGELMLALHRMDEARDCFEIALSYCGNKVERTSIKRKIKLSTISAA